MSVRKCLECKYFKKEDGFRVGRCELRGLKVVPNETCSDFTNEAISSDENLKKVLALEERVERLERIVTRLL